MKALITGGTGFIGSRLALRLLDAGHEVLALGRPGPAPRAEEENAGEDEPIYMVMDGSPLTSWGLKPSILLRRASGRRFVARF